jgi:hypothetical protein
MSCRVMLMVLMAAAEEWQCCRFATLCKTVWPCMHSQDGWCICHIASLETSTMLRIPCEYMHTRLGSNQLTGVHGREVCILL